MKGNEKNLYIAIGIIVILGMMIIPLPTPMLDFFMALNLMFSLAVILIVLYSEKTTDFTVFPSVLLLGTLFSLALNVSSTRLILTMGNSFNGRVIRTFSGFVVGSSGREGLVVGFIIFIILIAVQVVVITRGASRIAEVSARFSLEGMAQKNAAVDSEINSGAITADEANRKRTGIQKEADFYSAMDGASRFVSGSVRVGIIITCVNILGGLAVGCLIRGEEFQAACGTYVSFAVGDGLVSQIPALLLSAASALIVTRSNASGDFGAGIIREFSRDHKIYYIISVFMAVLGVVPGFRKAWYVFFPLAFLAFYIGNKIKNNRQESDNDNIKNEKLSEARTEIKPVSIASVEPLTLEIGCALLALVADENSQLLNRIGEVKNKVSNDLGFIVPAVHILDNLNLKPREYSIKVNDLECARFEIKTNAYLAVASDDSCADLDGNEFLEPVDGNKSYWIKASEKENAESAGYIVSDVTTLIANHLEKIIRENSHELLLRDNVLLILDNVKKKSSDLGQNILSRLSVGEIHRVFSALLYENVSIKNYPLILQLLEDSVSESADCSKLVENIRAGLKRQISLANADKDRNLSYISIDRDLLQKIPYMKDNLEFCRKFVAEAVLLGVENKNVILCPPDVRILIRNMMGRRGQVLSTAEISQDVKLISKGEIKL